MGEISWGNVYGDPAAQAAAAADKKLAAARLAQEKKLIAEQKRAAAAKLKAERDAQTLKKAGTMFDIDKIQIIAALQGKISDEEKLRLQLQFALLIGNAAEAERLSNQLAISQAATTQLAMAIAKLPAALNPFAEFPKWVQDAINELNKFKDAANVPATTTQPYIGSAQEIANARTISNAQGSRIRNEMMNPESGYYNPTLFGANTGGDTYVTVQVEVGGQQLTDVVTTQQINNSASGSQSRLNRLALMD